MAALDTYYHYSTPHGLVTIGSSKTGISRVEFGKTNLKGRCAPTKLTNRAASELQEYLAGKRTSFDVALDLEGSAFQRAVWCEVASIAYGHTATAADIAKALGKPGAHRSVGTAVRKCRLAPFIPAHRVAAPNATGRQAKILRAFLALEQRALSERP